MRIALVAVGYPYLTEAFTRREVAALRALGHDVRAFVGQIPRPEEAAADDGTIVTMATAANVRTFGPDILYTGIGTAAHQTCVSLAKGGGYPYVLRLWSGHDLFRYPSPEKYAKWSNDPLCMGCIVEDMLTWRWAIEKMTIPQAKLFIIPNSLPMCSIPRATDADAPILAIGRLVEKKGFIYLVRAARQINREVWIVGDGPERQQLESEAPASVRFLGTQPEESLPAMYARAAMLVAPCVQAANGDLDGIPTVIMEAMTAGCPVIASNIGSVPEYVINQGTGILVPPGNVDALAAAIRNVLDNHDRAERTARDAQKYAASHLDIATNVRHLEIVLTRHEPKRAGMLAAEQMVRRRAKYTPAQEQTYLNQKRKAFDFFKFEGRRVLDVGCGVGFADWFPEMEYVGVDVVLPDKPQFEAYRAEAEHLPFQDGSFDSVLMYSTLQFFHDPDAALAEAARVLKPGGKACIKVCVSDPNALFFSQWSRESAEDAIKSHLRLESSEVWNRTMLHVNARKQ